LRLQNAHGERVELSPTGAAVTEIFVRDREGRLGNVAVAEGGSAGKTIGRYANRIANGRFLLDEHVYQLATNEGGNTLHGGPHGFAARAWVAGAVRTGAGSASIEFRLHSDDGDQGFPGNLECSVVYSLDDDGRFGIRYAANVDAPTVINLTNHTYFDLSAGASPIATQWLRIDAQAYTPVDDTMIPTGTIEPVAGTSRDFRHLRRIGTQVYDCNFALENSDGTPRFVAEAVDERSGRRLRVMTTEPGLQLYTGKPNGVALETQHFPDSPNHANFPSTVLRPGQTLSSTTVYWFGIAL
jgi:aldose 1-epimerase